MTPVTEQRNTALKQANEVRSLRSQIRAQLFDSGTRQESMQKLAELLAFSPPIIHDMKLSKLLLSCYGIGESYMRQILTHINASESRRVADLTERQHDKLLSYLTNNG